jgi:hypothetical protein
MSRPAQAQQPMNKPTVVEIPINATDQAVRIQLDEIQKVIRQARALQRDRVRVTIQQGE